MAPSAEWFRHRAEAAGDVFFVLRTRPDIALEYISERIVDYLGYTAEELLAEPTMLPEQVDTRDRERLAALLATAPGEQVALDLRWVAKDGSPSWSQIVLEAVEREDGSVTLEGNAHDVTALKLAERALTESEQKYRLLAENAWDVIWTMELDGTISYVSPAVERVRGFTPDEAKAQTLDQIHPPDSAAKSAEYFGQLYASMAEGAVPPPYRGEREYYRKDGSIMYGELDVIPQVDEDGQVIRILGVTRDISDQRRYEAELNRLAVTDPLTGAWNRRHGEQIFNADLEEARRYGPPLSLLMVDIDHFKDINDTFGHHVGDTVLLELTRRLSENLRGSDALVRWGGEEFVILTRHCTIEQALPLAEKVRGLVADEPFDGVGTVTVSIGVSQLHPTDDLSSWMDRADRAMYAAKAAGRNTVRAAAEG